MSALTLRGRSAAVWLRIAAAVALLVVGFALLEQPARMLEVHAYSGLLKLFGFRGISTVSGSEVYLIPDHRAPFWVDLTASCSSLAPVLTLGCLAMMLPRAPGSTGRAVASYGAAVFAIIVGNLVRIDASIVAGLRYGESALVLFHDSAGTVFAFGYTLGGFVLMLWMQLPDLRRAEAARPGAPPAPVTAEST